MFCFSYSLVFFCLKTVYYTSFFLFAQGKIRRKTRRIPEKNRWNRKKKKKRNFLLFKIETGIILFFFSLSAYFTCIMHPRR